MFILYLYSMYAYISLKSIEVLTIRYFCAKLRIFSEPTKKKSCFFTVKGVFFAFRSFFSAKVCVIGKNIVPLQPVKSYYNKRQRNEERNSSRKLSPRRVP